MEFLKDLDFQNKEVEELKKNISELLQKNLENQQKLVQTNINFLRDLGIPNYKEVFKEYYEIFLLDNSNFKDIFNKYDKDDLIDKIMKDIHIIEYL